MLSRPLPGLYRGPYLALYQGSYLALYLTDRTPPRPPLLDADALQRGDAEMENRMNRVIRACVEMGDKNPIVSIHDQGAVRGLI